MTEALTTDEARWIKRLQKVLNACPSTRLGFYTTGDPALTIYDRENGEEQDVREVDFYQNVADHNAWLGEVKFPANVHATCA